MTLEEQYENETGVQWSEFDCKLCFDGDYIQWLESLVATRTAERDAAILQRDGLESIIVKLKL